MPENLKLEKLDAKDIRFGDNYMPFGYTKYADGSILLQALPEFINIAAELINNSDDYIYDKIAGYMLREFNLVPDREKASDIIYGISDKNKLRLEKKQGSTIKFDGACAYKIIEKYVYIDKDKPGVFFGALIDDKIVSVAKYNVKNEIAAGTHENYRGRGYAVSNVVALAEYLLDSGASVKYCTDSANISSQKTAESAGFELMSREKLFWFK